MLHKSYPSGQVYIPNGGSGGGSTGSGGLQGGDAVVNQDPTGNQGGGFGPYLSIGDWGPLMKWSMKDGPWKGGCPFVAILICIQKDLSWHMTDHRWKSKKLLSIPGTNSAPGLRRGVSDIEKFIHRTHFPLPSPLLQKFTICILRPCRMRGNGSPCSTEVVTAIFQSIFHQHFLSCLCFSWLCLLNMTVLYEDRGTERNCIIFPEPQNFKTKVSSMPALLARTCSFSYASLIAMGRSTLWKCCPWA